MHTNTGEMIESTRIKRMIEVGDRAVIEIDGIAYSGFVKELEDDGVTIEWREIELNANNAEQMITKSCFIDRELIKTITKIK